MSTKFINEPVVEIDELGNKIPFIPVRITNGRQAYAASLNIIFKHIADFHITVLSIIAEKYNLNVDEILEEVHKDDRYNRMTGVINNFGLFDGEQYEPAPITLEHPESIPSIATTTTRENTPAAPVAKKVVRKRKTKAELEAEANTKASAGPESEQAQVEEITADMDNMSIKTEEKPKKRVYKKKTVEATA